MGKLEFYACCLAWALGCGATLITRIPILTKNLLTQRREICQSACHRWVVTSAYRNFMMLIPLKAELRSKMWKADTCKLRTNLKPFTQLITWKFSCCFFVKAVGCSLCSSGKEVSVEVSNDFNQCLLK